MRAVRHAAPAAVHVLRRRVLTHTQPIAVREATAADAAEIHALILEHLAEGHLLPREQGEIARHATRFVVATQGRTVVACAELAPLSRTVAEVRSFVVSREARSLGIGTRLIDVLLAQSQVAGFHTLCAFTHSPGYFVNRGFSIVPHLWLPEKIATDCRGCRHFRQCDQYAVMQSVPRPVKGRPTMHGSGHECVPLAALHG